MVLLKSVASPRLSFCHFVVVVVLSVPHPPGASRDRPSYHGYEGTVVHGIGRAVQQQEGQEQGEEGAFETVDHDRTSAVVDVAGGSRGNTDGTVVGMVGRGVAYCEVWGVVVGLHRVVLLHVTVSHEDVVFVIALVMMLLVLTVCCLLCEGRIPSGPWTVS